MKGQIFSLFQVCVYVVLGAGHLPAWRHRLLVGYLLIFIWLFSLAEEKTNSWLFSYWTGRLEWWPALFRHTRTGEMGPLFQAQWANAPNFHRASYTHERTVPPLFELSKNVDDTNTTVYLFHVGQECSCWPSITAEKKERNDWLLRFPKIFLLVNFDSYRLFLFMSRQLLKHHVVAGSVPSSALQNNGVLQSLLSTPLRVKFYESEDSEWRPLKVNMFSWLFYGIRKKKRCFRANERSSQQSTSLPKKKTQREEIFFKLSPRQMIRKKKPH